MTLKRYISMTATSREREGTASFVHFTPSGCPHFPSLGRVKTNLYTILTICYNYVGNQINFCSPHNYNLSMSELLP